MIESVACALEFMNNEETTETRRFIRLTDMFFDCLNVKDTLSATIKRKEYRAPYRSPRDMRFKVSLLKIAIEYSLFSYLY